MAAPSPSSQFSTGTGLAWWSIGGFFSSDLLWHTCKIRWLIISILTVSIIRDQKKEKSNLTERCLGDRELLFSFRLPLPTSLNKNIVRIQYLLRFGGVRTFSHSQSTPRDQHQSYISIRICTCPLLARNGLALELRPGSKSSSMKIVFRISIVIVGFHCEH